MNNDEAHMWDLRVLHCMSSCQDKIWPVLYMYARYIPTVWQEKKIGQNFLDKPSFLKLKLVI